MATAIETSDVRRPVFLSNLPSSVSIDAAPLSLEEGIVSPNEILEYSPHVKGDDQDLLTIKTKDSQNQIESAVFKDSEFKSSDWKSELEKYKESMPPDLKIGYYDVAILYAEEERHLALKFKSHLENDIELSCGEKVKVVLYDGSEMVALTGTFTKQLDHVLERCTQIFMYLSERFCNETWMGYASEACLTEAIYNAEKKWCCVPIFGYPRATTPYKIPVVLNCLKGVNYYNNDQFYRRALARLIKDKQCKRLEKEYVHEQKQLQWLQEFKIKEEQRLFQNRIREMKYRAELEKTKTNLIQKEEAYARHFTELSRNKPLGENHIDSEVEKGTQYFQLPSLNMKTSMNSEHSKSYPENNLVYPNNRSDCQDSKGNVSLSDNIQSVSSLLSHKTLSSSEEQPNSPQNLDDAMRNIALSKSDSFSKTSSCPIQPGQKGLICKYQQEALSCFEKYTSSSTAQQDAATSVPIEENLCVGPYAGNKNQEECSQNWEENSYAFKDIRSSQGDKPLSSQQVSETHIRPTLGDNMPNLSLLETGEEINEHSNFYNESSRESGPDARSKSTAATTIPNLSLFDSRDYEMTSNISSSVQQTGVPEQIPTNILSTQKDTSSKPPHTIKSSLGSTDLDVDAHYLPDDAEAVPTPKEIRDRNSAKNDGSKIIVREIHHHHYENKDQHPKVINIYGAGTVQLGESNTAVVRKNDNSASDDDVCEELCAEQKTANTPAKAMKPKNSPDCGTREDVSEMGVGMVPNAMRSSQDTGQQLKEDVDSLTTVKGYEVTSVSTKSCDDRKGLQTANSLLHPLDPDYPVDEPVQDNSTQEINNSSGSDTFCLIGEKNCSEENIDPTIFYSQKGKKVRSDSTSSNNRCILS